MLLVTKVDYLFQCKVLDSWCLGPTSLFWLVWDWHLSSSLSRYIYIPIGLVGLVSRSIIYWALSCVQHSFRPVLKRGSVYCPSLVTSSWPSICFVWCPGWECIGVPLVDMTAVSCPGTTDWLSLSSHSPLLQSPPLPSSPLFCSTRYTALLMLKCNALWVL